MSYHIQYFATISYVGDGTGPMGVPGSPSRRFQQLADIIVPGGNAPSSGNMATAATAVATDLTGQLQNAANLAQIQGWATGTTQ